MRPLRAVKVARDSLAGVEVAAMSIPQTLGYASIAGMPSVTGFYTLFLPLLAFATFGSSRFLVVAADSATAAILAGGLAPMAPAGSAEYVELAGMVALLTAGMLMLARLLKLGFLADFLSRTVLAGFLTGVGFQVGIAVLGQMLGLDVRVHGTVGQLAEIFRDAAATHLPTAGISLLVAGGILAIDRLAPRVPGPLIAMAGAIAASAVWDFAGHGIATIGPVAGGLPRLHIPRAVWAEIQALIPIAGSCTVMIIAQSAATARFYAMRHQERADENADLAGLAAANAVAALSGTFVVNGSPTQTGMMERSGAQSQVAHVATAVAVGLTLLVLTGPLQYLPRCVVGAIVFVVAIHLMDFSGMAAIRKESPGEFALAVTTAAIVVLVGVEQGIVFAMVLSLLRIVRHSYRPHTAVLVHDGPAWQLRPVASGAETEPGLVVYRFGATLFYANAGRFAEEIRELARKPHVRWIVVDAGAITNVDYTAAQVVRELLRDLRERGVELVLAHVQSDLKPDLDRHGLTKAIGPERIFDTLRDAEAGFARL